MTKDSTNVKASVFLIVAISLSLMVSTTMAQEPSTRVRANTKASSGVPLRTAADATGVGTQNFIAKWTDGIGTLGNSLLFDNGSRVGVATTNPQTLFQVGASGADLPNMPATTLYVTGVGVTGAVGIAARDVVNHVELAIGTAALGGGQFVGLFGTRTPHNLYLQANGNNFMILTTGGAVGIGTLTPTAMLSVAGSVSVASNLTVSGNIAAKYQDLAEWVPMDGASLDGGTLVVLSPGKSNTVRASSTAYDTTVAGVVSNQPGIILGEASDTKAMIATTGRVKVRVDATDGPIAIGDLLVSSDTPGYAMRSKPVDLGGVQIHRPGTIIGKALEPLSTGKGEILVLLTLQ
jgi:hypothetical protein